MNELLGHFNYWIVVILMMMGLYIVIASSNLVKKLIGLSVFQVSVFILYITFGKVTEGSPPIITDNTDVYSNPLPHVLILTAIVVGVATTSVGLALIVRIQEAYGSIDEDDIHAMDDKDDFPIDKQV
ncbi:MAG: PH adaptation potassium efflux system protein C; sodium- potassium/hydrogen antiporter subunit C [uncultured Sulfurovum sp.]|uniref:PH adaptation potassium efflux system protein C sodium- potassium/hydrogen antiporter subunit C n=1 Tax=uncultured Sulfurovum sp. TaxID=269237 RepID=A0A6S6TM06_9BACT|nr:MAG: PH adaptation potassium efflux system protein C; sodium- potassium/hydrogen antiporter subunit C [uncultured Sulfurovum sp.]